MTKKDFINYLIEQAAKLAEKKWETEDEIEEIYLKGKLDAYHEILKKLKSD